MNLAKRGGVVMAERSSEGGRRKRSRRELLAGAAGAAGVVAAQTALGAKAAYATDPNDVVLGQGGQMESNFTEIINTRTDSAGAATAIIGHARGSAAGVYGAADGAGGTGVHGVAGAGNGVLGSADAGDGVQGQTFNASNSGVYGHNESLGTGGKGVFGASPNGVAVEGLGGQIGVHGVSAGGTGVLADSANGTALAVSGKAQFSRSGLVTVVAGARAKTVKNVALTSASFILATVQDETDVSVKAVVRDLTNSSFKIVLTKAATFNTPVGWFVIS
jgi:hypothetical protein